MIGEKIRSIRKGKNLTIVELSEQIDVTSGYISQIERDLISPSLSVLKKLTKALDIPLSALFLDDTSKNVVKITEKDRTKVKFGNINVELEFITPIIKNNDKSCSVEAFLFKLPPKTWLSDNTVVHETSVCNFVLNGKLDCYIGEKVHVLSSGDSIYIPENNEHMIYNSNDEVTEVLSIIAPSKLN